jgi:hypothetical protein
MLGSCGLDASGSGYGQLAGSGEDCNELLGSKKVDMFLDGVTIFFRRRILLHGVSLPLVGWFL